MSEIAINEDILDYAERLYPLVAKMQSFVVMQQQLYAAFSSYSGEAKKEIDEYAEKQMYQLLLMCNGYAALAKNLLAIIEAFKITDEASMKRITAFSDNVNLSLNNESDRMKKVLESLGIGEV